MSQKEKAKFNIKQFALPALGIITIALAFFSGTLWQKVQSLEKGGATGTTTQTTAKAGIGNDKAQSGKLADFLKSAIDPGFLKSCLDSGKYDARLTSDAQLAASLGVQGTPGFFVNSMFYAGAYSWDSNLTDSKTNAVIQNSSMKAVVGGAQPNSNSPVSLSTLKGLWNKDLLKFGDGKSDVLFIVVSDPSCPYCHIASGLNQTLIQGFDKSGNYIAPVPEMRKLVESGKASMVYIYQAGHGNGEMGMKALYCANEQGKFWQVENLLMTNDGYVLMNGS